MFYLFCSKFPNIPDKKEIGNYKVLFLLNKRKKKMPEKQTNPVIFHSNQFLSAFEFYLNDTETKF